MTSRLLQVEILAHQARPDHLKTAISKETTRSSKNWNASGKGINIRSPCRSLTDYNCTPTSDLAIWGRFQSQLQRPSRESILDHLSDHQLNHHTQTSKNWKTALLTVQAVQELHVMHEKPGKFWRF